MKRQALLSVLLILAALAAWGDCAGPAAAADDGAGNPSNQEVARVIENLAGNSADGIQAAEQELLKLGDQAAPALKQVIKAGNPEVAERAKRIVAQQVTRNVQNLGSSSEKLADAAEASLVRWKYLAVPALEETVKNDPDRAVRAARILEKILVYTHVVLDALGAPIDGGVLELTIEFRAKPGEPIRTNKRTYLPDERGYVSLEMPNESAKCTARFQHPDYGRSERSFYRGDQLKELRFPLVNRHSPALTRALRGKVTDPDDKPVAGAIIAGGSVRTPGMGLIQGTETPAITNEDGYFAYYPVVSSKKRLDIPELIPAASNYTIVVKVPEDPSLFPSRVEHGNNTEVAVKLERAERFHKLKFAAAAGGFLEGNDLRMISLSYSKTDKAQRVALDPTWTVSGAKLLPGVYHAQFKEQLYAPLVVTKDSPEELVFRPRLALAMHGRVVHGVTGEPMPGILVLGYASVRQGTLAMLTDEEWQRLRTLREGALVSDAALAPVARCFGLLTFALTDEAGKYTIIQKPHADIYGVIAVAENFLPIMQPKYRMTTLGAVAAVPNLPLFPAAKVLVQPDCEKKNVSILPTWRFEADGQPEWFKQFAGATDSKLQRQFKHDNWMSSELQPVYVPADISLKIELRAPYDEELSRVIAPDVIRLKQGETKTIGPIHLPTAVKVEVAVADDQGKPLADVVVRRNYDNIWSVPHLTGANGRATFFVNRNSSGSFAVRLKDELGGPKRDQAPNLFAAFEVKEEAAVAEPYKITLTAEQVKTLAKERGKK